MHLPSLSSLVRAATLAVLCSSAAAQRVWVVAPLVGPGVDFTIIQSAVSAAADGDTILVRAGTYATAEVRTKALVLVGENATLQSPTGNFTLVIEGTRADQSVVVRGFAVNTIGRALDVTNCSGPVLIDSSMKLYASSVGDGGPHR